MKHLAILGSTGSIGTQALDIVRRHPKAFKVCVLTGNNNVSLLVEQALEFHPDVVVAANPDHHETLCRALRKQPVKVYSGSEAIVEAAALPDVEIVLTAMVGYAGLAPTLSAIDAGKIIALSNKETLVVAGNLIKQRAAASGSVIIPVDSEHSAIYQCLLGEQNAIEEILLTASGGPFLHKSMEELQHVTPAEAMRHPNWQMGVKVTIDSASLMNKGFEVIEAHYLFDVKPEKIKVLVHPESLVHSMVQFADGSVKAQIGIPDMRLPISFAFGLGKRLANDFPRLDFTARPLTFLPPDTGRFPNLDLAYEAVCRGGTAPCVLNAANEIAVAAFLEGRLPFRKMSDLIAAVLCSCPHQRAADLPTLVAADKEARRMALERL